MTKTFYYCTRCAHGLAVNDEICSACGHNTIDANRVINLQSGGIRPNRKRPRGAAATASDPRRDTSAADEPPSRL